MKTEVKLRWFQTQTQKARQNRVDSEHTLGAKVTLQTISFSRTHKKVKPVCDEPRVQIRKLILLI